MPELDPQNLAHNEELQREVINQFRDKQSKYAYYLIALCVAAIAFSVNITINIKLNYDQIPLGLAVLNWAISIVCGFMFIESHLGILYINNKYLEVITGRHPVSGLHPEKIEIGAQTLLKIMETKSNKGSDIAMGQKATFYIGMISFLLWWVIKMYHN